MKTACFVEKVSSYDAADAFFKANGMESYSTTTADEYTEAKNWLTIMFGRGSGAEIWPSVKLIGDHWTTSDGKLLFSGAVPTQNLGQGFCALFSNANGNFELIVKDCAVSSASIGEFFDETKKSLTSIVRIPIDPETYSCG